MSKPTPPAPDELVTMTALADWVVQLGLEPSMSPQRVRRLAETDPLFPLAGARRIGRYLLVPAGPALRYFTIRDRSRDPNKWRSAHPWLREHGQELVDAAADVVAQPLAALGLAGNPEAANDHAQLTHAVQQARTAPHDGGETGPATWLHAASRVLTHSSLLMRRAATPATPAAAAARERLARLVAAAPATPGA